MLVDKVKGFGVTLREFANPPVTEQYPDERRRLSTRFRGLPVLLSDPETGEAKCVACGMCAVACPNNVIDMTSEDDPIKGRRPVTYTIKADRCLFCGLCVEGCPVKAIAMSHHFELSDTSKSNLLYEMPYLLELGKGLR